MDISSHILEAVQTASDSIPPRRVKSAHAGAKDVPYRSRFPKSRSVHSSVENLSTTSDSEVDHGYQTDFTSLPSDSSPEDVAMEEIDDFREREYPQLKDRVYMDHGGTTVSHENECRVGSIQRTNVILAICAVTHRGILS